MEVMDTCWLYNTFISPCYLILCVNLLQTEKTPPEKYLLKKGGVRIVKCLTLEQLMMRNSIYMTD